MAKGVSMFYSGFAWCNDCEWSGPMRYTREAAEADLHLHEDTPGHFALTQQPAGGNDR